MTKWAAIAGLVLILSLGVVRLGVNLLDSRKDLQVESFNDIETKEIICFNNASGILWKCQPEPEIVEEYLSSSTWSPENQIIGIGLEGSTRYIIFFKYSGLKNKLVTYGKARNIKCHCCNDIFKGEVLEGVFRETLQDALKLSASAGGFFLG